MRKTLWIVLLLAGLGAGLWTWLGSSGPGDEVEEVAVETPAASRRMGEGRRSGLPGGGTDRPRATGSAAADLWRPGEKASPEPAAADPGAAIAQARQFVQEGKTDEAIAVLEGAVREEPDHGRLKETLGFAYLQGGRADDAEAIFADEVVREPDNPNGHYGLALVDRARGNLDGALEKLNDTLARDPSHPDAKYQMADLYTFDKRSAPELAERYYQDVLHGQPQNAEAQNGLAAVYLATGRNEQATGLWEKLATEYPEDSNLQSNLGEAYLRSGKIQEGVQSCQKAIEHDPNNSEAYYLLGLAAEQQGDAATAQQYFQKAVALKPDDPDYQAKAGSPPPQPSPLEGEEVTH